MDFALTAEQQMVVDTVRDFVERKLYPHEDIQSDLPLARFWRDARVERIWDGTSEIQRHIIGRDLLRPLGA